MVKWSDRPGIHEAVASLMSDITIRHKFEDCTDIPDNFEYTTEFELNPQHRAHYEDLRKHSVLELARGDVSAVHAASLATKLLQVASGAAYGEAISATDKYFLIDSDRYELVTDLANARQHSIVFFLWTHQRDELIKHAMASGLTYAVIDGSTSDSKREEIVAQYQMGFYRVLFAHPASAAHGLTLVKGTATIWASPPHNLDWFVQGNRRIYRTGQKHKTETIIVVAKDTIEEKVYASLMNKNVNMQSLLGMLE
jgi:SNF2 family DNA or RNA helicase